MSKLSTREREAGELYSEGWKAIQHGGDELHLAAMHLILMIKGTTDFPAPPALWITRELRDGKIVTLDRFVDYLFRQPRDGLGLPSFYFLKQVLEATPKDGQRALALVRAELAKEHVNFDEAARRDELKLHGEQAPLPAHGEIGRGRSNRVDNIKSKTEGGTSAAYLAARLRRDFPEIADRLAAGEFRSVNAAAIEAGFRKPPTPLTVVRRAWKHMSAEDRAIFLAEVGAQWRGEP